MEIIKRTEGQKADKQEIPEGHAQISLNSDSRLVVRQIYSQANDTLVVFDPTTSMNIIRFIRKLDADFNEREIPF